jgi:hypothetical protein
VGGEAGGERLGKRRGGGQADRRDGQVGRAPPAQRGLKADDPRLRVTGDVQERGDQQEPHAGRQPGADRQHAGGGQQHGEGPAGRGGLVGGAHAVAVDPPQQRTGHTPAVQRERRQQVEDEDRRVDEHLVLERRVQPAAAGRQQPRAREHGEQDGGHRRAGQGEQQLVGRARRLSAQARDAAQQPQVDLLDVDAVTARDERVADLVQQDPGEQQQRAERAQRIGPRGRDGRDVVGEPGVPQRPGQERGHDHPQRLDADGDAGDAPEADGPHGPTAAARPPSANP